MQLNGKSTSGSFKHQEEEPLAFEILSNSFHMAARGTGDRPSKSKRTKTRVIVTTSCGLLLGVLIGCSLVKFGQDNLSKIGDGTFFCDHAPSGGSSGGLSGGSSGGPSEARSNTVPHLMASKRPRGTEGLPPGIIVPETDLYERRLCGNPEEDLPEDPSKYLVTFTVGVQQKESVNLAVAKFPKKWTIMLFHYDGSVNDWDEFEWSKTAIHVSAQKQTKWWYAKRFLHPDVVAPYNYIFLWDEDLGVEHFDAEEYIALVRKHGLEISQPGLENAPTWEMTSRRADGEVHKTAVEKPGLCLDPLKPPCAGFVEIMAPVFSGKAWRCVWHMIQNDLVHGWGLDFTMQRCVEPAHEKMGVVDSQWIRHKGMPTLGGQGVAKNGKAAWEGVRERCNTEWRVFQKRMDAADRSLGKSGENL